MSEAPDDSVNNKISKNVEIRAQDDKLSLDKMVTDIDQKIGEFSKREFVTRESKIATGLDALVEELKAIKYDIDNNLDIVEMIDLLIDTYTYKQYECTHNYTNRMEAMKAHQNVLLASNLSRSNLVLQLAEIDQALQDTREHYEKKSSALNEGKITGQDKYETIVQMLDSAFDSFLKHYDKLAGIHEDSKIAATPSELSFLENTYQDAISSFEYNIAEYKKMQHTGWRIIHSEERIASLMESKGLKVTKSGRIITKKGDLFSLKEAFNRGLLEGIDIEWTNYFEKNLLPGYLGGVSSETLSISTKMSNEDLSYLKTTVGKPLTLALAEITAKRPKDPIHYLAHWLFKYRYNKEITNEQEQDIKKLNAERERIAKEQWKAFLEREARAAVSDIIMLAENTAIENELRRIAMEAAMGEEEYEEGLDDEARDQLGVYTGPPVGKRTSLL